MTIRTTKGDLVIEAVVDWQFIAIILVFLTEEPEAPGVSRGFSVIYVR